MADTFAELLAQGERAAFHGPPSRGIAALQQAVVEGRAHQRDTEAAMAAWLLGVCLSASGRWSDSLTVLRPLMLEVTAASEVSAERRLVASLAASTSAAVLRQVGRRTDAVALDEIAMTLASGSHEAEFDALVGLVADAVGADDPGSAAEPLARAEALAGARSDWWRQRVRLDWARTEVALLEGRPHDAAVRAAAALTRAEASGAPRHVAKSLLLLGVALVQRGDLEDAVDALRRCVTLADSLGAMPLVFPSRALLGALAAVDDPARSQALLAQARTAALALADELSDDPPEHLRSTWLGRDDVAAIVASA